LKGNDVGRRGRILTVAAITAAAGLAVALVVVRPGGDRLGPQLIGGEGSGNVTLEPTLVQPRVSGTTIAPSTPESSSAPEGGADVPGVQAPTSTPTGLGVNVGSVGGLYPGHRVEVGVTYVNPYSFPIAIETVQVDAAGTTRCTGRHLLPAATAPVRVPARSARASTIEVGMRKSAPDACQGVRFALRVQATAVQL
jgi:hypothetical protein